MEFVGWNFCIFNFWTNNHQNIKLIKVQSIFQQRLNFIKFHHLDNLIIQDLDIFMIHLMYCMKQLLLIKILDALI